MELVILLLQSPECWDYQCVPLCPAHWIYFNEIELGCVSCVIYFYEEDTEETLKGINRKRGGTPPPQKTQGINANALNQEEEETPVALSTVFSSILFP